jgi:uncharacterized protein
MKKVLLSTLLVAALFFAHAQDLTPIVIGKIDTLYSKVLNEKRAIWIYTPEMTLQKPLENRRYPVLYLLDGDAHFTSMVGMVHQLSQVNGNTVLPEMIVVGITNTNRMRDLSPADVETLKTGTQGGGSFVQFLETELMPYIEKQYNTAPYKTLVGHSLGGLMAIDILTNKPDLFNAYISIDPSMWYNNEKHLNHAMAHLPNNKLQNKRLFIGAANTMPKGMTLAKLKKDKSAATQHIRSIFKLDKYLKNNPVAGLKYAQKYYSTDSHVSVPLICQYDGLRFVFDYYLMDIEQSDFIDSTALIATKFREHYNKISKEMGCKVAPPEAFIDYLANDARSKKQYAKADALFKLNKENYPNEIKTPDAYTVTEKDLQKYTGNYLIQVYNIPVTLKLKNGALWSSVPGQEESEFVPVSKGVFTVKNKKGYQITFEMNGDTPVSFTSVQPNGTFKIVKQ